MNPVPENPKQGDTIVWYSLDGTGDGIMKFRATYYEFAHCQDVIGRGGVSFCQEWYVQNWYIPSGSESAGGRNSTNDLREVLGTGLALANIYLTFKEAKVALFKNLTARHDLHRLNANRYARLAGESVNYEDVDA